MKKGIIFGASGFVGPYLTRELEEHGYQVFQSDIRPLASGNDQRFFEAVDLLDRDAVERYIERVQPDAIVNLAAVSSVGLSWKIPQNTMSVNVVGTINILEGARKCDCPPKVLLIGSSEQYANSDKPIAESWSVVSNNPYGISKAAQEQFANLYRERYHLPICCVRAFNHTGIGQSDTFVLPDFCKQVARIEKSHATGVIQVGNLSPKRDFGDVRDFVRAYRMILEASNPAALYNVGTGNAYTIQALLEYIVSLSSQKITIETAPERFRPADNPLSCCDYTKIKTELGWEPEYSIFDTIQEMVAYYLSQE